MNNFASSLGKESKFLIFGCGFSGNFFAKTIRNLGYTALTSSRTYNRDQNSFVFNSDDEEIPDDKIFEGVTHVLSCIPPGKNGKDPLLSILKSKLQNLSLKWIGYLSTTGVYGDTKGAWVSEINQPNPLQKRNYPL